MHSLWNAGDRQSLIQRLRTVRATDSARWGRMTAPAMLAHLIATLRYAVAAPEPRPSRRRIRPLRWPPVKYAFVYLMRFPREAPTPARFIVEPDEPFDDQIETAERLMNEVARLAAAPDARMPKHPFFGNLTKHAWGVLGYKHTDHHLRQFSR